MSNMVLGYQNAVLAGSVSASSSVAGLGADQLQNDQGNAASALQIPATSGTITLTFTGDYRAFGLFRTNLTTAAVVTFTVQSGGNAVYTGAAAAVSPGYGQAVHVAASDYEGDQLVVSISDPTNSDGFLNIPLMYAGAVWQPIKNYDLSSAPNRTQQTDTATTRSGGVIKRNDWIKRTFGLSMSMIRFDEASTAQDLDLAARQGANILFVPNPESEAIAREALFGELEPGSNGLTWTQSSSRWRGYQATLTERL